MIEPVEPGGGLEVERQRLTNTRRGVWPVIVAGLAVVAVAVLGGRLGAGGTTIASPSPSPTKSSRPTIRPPSTEPPPSLPSIANQVLAFPSTVALVRRDGASLELLGWQSGDPDFRPFAQMSDVFPNSDSVQAAGSDLSPDGRLALIMTIDATDLSGKVRAQVRSVDAGNLVWESDPTEGFPAPLWSQDSRAVAITPSTGPWLVTALDDLGRVRPHRIPVPNTIGLENPGDGPEWIAVGFSRDRRWLYAVSLESQVPRAAWRVDVATGKRQELERFALTGPGGLVPDPSTPVAVDPASGRLMGRFGGENSVNVFEPDGTLAFSVPVSTNQGASWTGDGGLAVLETQGEVRSGATRLFVVDAAGNRADPIWEFPAVQAVGLLNAGNGHALMFLAADFEASDVRVVLIRLSDGATSAVRPDPAIVEQTIGLDWFDPSP